jgi:hypothetical protein
MCSNTSSAFTPARASFPSLARSMARRAAPLQPSDVLRHAAQRAKNRKLSMSKKKIAPLVSNAVAGFALACSLAVPLMARAQTMSTVQPVKWELQVIRDGQQIDAFSATTSVGQARTDTHHHKVQNRVGCANQPAGDIDLQRTLTVSPTHASADDVTLAIDAQETIEESDDRATAQARRMGHLADRRQESVAGLPGPREPRRGRASTMIARR